MSEEAIRASGSLKLFFRADTHSADFLEDLERRRKLRVNDGYFAYILMPYLRNLLRKAADNGDFQIAQKVKGIGNMIFNFDVGSGSKARPGPDVNTSRPKHRVLFIAALLGQRRRI